MIMAPAKDPHSVIDYGLDWIDWLDGDQIVASSWACDSDQLLIVDQTFVPSSTAVWLVGGVVGASYRVTNTITTASNRVEQRTLLIPCDER